MNKMRRPSQASCVPLVTSSVALSASVILGKVFALNAFLANPSFAPDTTCAAQPQKPPPKPQMPLKPSCVGVMLLWDRSGGSDLPDGCHGCLSDENVGGVEASAARRAPANKGLIDETMMQDRKRNNAHFFPASSRIDDYDRNFKLVSKVTISLSSLIE